LRAVGIRLSHTPAISQPFLDDVCIQRFGAHDDRHRRKLCQTSSLTAISLSCLSRSASQGVMEVIGTGVAPALKGELAAAS